MVVYSIDLRTRVLSYVFSGGSRLSASKIFKISERTVRNWIRLHEDTGSLQPRPHGGGFVSKIDSDEFKGYVADNPDKTLHEMGEHFGITHSGVAYNLSKHGYVYKKNTSLLGTRRRKKTKISGWDSGYTA